MSHQNQTELGPKQSGAGSRSRSISPEGTRPPLPPRPSNLTIFRNASNSAQIQSSRRGLLSRATTALSLTDVNTQSFQDGSRELHTTGVSRPTPAHSIRSRRSIAQIKSGKNSDAGDSSSVISYIQNNDTTQEVESLFGERLGPGDDLLGKNALDSKDIYTVPEAEARHFEDANIDFSEEFQSVGEVTPDQGNEDEVLQRWKSKRKHFIILSAAGKPIYTRHGDDRLISSYVGIIQTLISFYKGSDDPLQSFSAGGALFVILSQGPLFFVAISRLHESDSQLRTQLDALYMQILSTLTLPNLTHLFSVRPSTDLKRPLQGTEVLLSSLADTFTRGSPSTLLSALECLKLRKSHRTVINNTLLRSRVDSLLYGLVVAASRLVSVIRPKKHSLHPSDLLLIFNMIFEAEGVKAGGGESWIPICLPGFNNKGYLYMYVSFLDLSGDSPEPASEDKIAKEEAVAIILISAEKEAFFDMRRMRDDLVAQMEQNGSIAIIKQAVHTGRLTNTDIVPGTVIKHFLYKSKGNVQFVMPSYSPHYTTPEARRSLLSTYHILNASVHSKHAHVKVHHSVGSTASLAWVTPMFELYCIAGKNVPRNALAQGANKLVQWVQREEERVFIIGGAVF
ncbi:MAG: hypothetical protein Q9227_002078 [Pyrenula ochraceoflavens]